MSRWLALPLGLVFLGACFGLGARWTPWVVEGEHPNLGDWRLYARFSPDGRRLLRVEPPEVRSYDLATGVDSLRTLEGFTADYGVLSLDGRRALAADDTGGVDVWDVDSGLRIRRLEVYKDERAFADLSPDGELVATSNGQGPIQVWRVRDGAEQARLGTSGKIGELVRFSPDGTRLLCARGAFRMWDLRDGRELFSDPALDPWHLAFSEDGARLLIDRPLPASPGVGVVDAWSGRLIAEHKVPLRVTEMRFIPGSSMAILTSNSCKADGSIRVLDTRTGAFPVTKRHTAMLTNVAVSPDGRRVLFCGYNPEGKGSTLWYRRRPEPWWGVAWLPEFWVALVSAAALLGLTVQALRRPTVPAPESRVPVAV